MKVSRKLLLSLILIISSSSTSFSQGMWNIFDRSESHAYFDNHLQVGISTMFQQKMKMPHFGAHLKYLFNNSLYIKLSAYPYQGIKRDGYLKAIALDSLNTNQTIPYTFSEKSSYILLNFGQETRLTRNEDHIVQLRAGYTVGLSISLFKGVYDIPPYDKNNYSVNLPYSNSPTINELSTTANVGGFLTMEVELWPYSVEKNFCYYFFEIEPLFFIYSPSKLKPDFSIYSNFFFAINTGIKFEL